LNDSRQNAETNDSSSIFSAKQIKKRVIKEFLDVIILVEIKKNGALSGYDLEMSQNRKYMIALSPGTIYSAVYALERKGFLKGDSEGKRTVFSLTGKGEDALVTLQQSGRELSEFLQSLFSF
jgi:DNA-binding PadR family transcriptional regulator